MAEDIGAAHHPVNLSTGARIDDPWHVQNVNAHHNRFKNWMRRFNGMATRQLESVLGGFRAIGRLPDARLKPAQWLAIAVDGDAINTP